MLHDPLVDKFRKHKIWKKKLKRAKALGQTEKVKELLRKETKYSLNHLIKERYPTFTDALRDLDDAVTMIHLFQHMSSGKITPERAERCRRLCLEFQYYVAQTHSLRKVFVSIKGIYYQAEIFGQTITWITPHHFNQRITKNIDYKIMLAFLEFHEVLMGFVNFKLFHNLGLKYPPQHSEEKLSQGEFFKSLIAESLTTKKEEETKESKEVRRMKKRSEGRLKTLSETIQSIQNDMEEEDNNLDNDDHNDGDEEEDNLDVFDSSDVKLAEEDSVYSTLFKDCLFFISREVPRESLEFVIRSFGGSITWEGGLIDESSDQITHQIVDRGVDPTNPHPNREYIQPQWVYDSVNEKALLPVDLYKPTAKLPPHLSPFVNDEEEGYIPEFRKKLDEITQRTRNDNSGKVDENDESDEDFEEIEERYQMELEEERKGEYKNHDNDDDESEEPKKSNKKKRTAKNDDEEAQKMAHSLLSAKKRKLLAHIEKGKKKRSERIEKLIEKKEKLDKKELVVEDGKLKKSKK